MQIQLYSSLETAQSTVLKLGLEQQMPPQQKSYTLSK
jgi:hypothetical protein